VSGVAVSRVRIRAPGGDPLAARLRVGRLLASASVDAGLPPAALLVVRRLADPRPGALARDRHALRPPAAWERALGESLRSLAAAAARPVREAVPAGAEAVLFADEAELLACLAVDVHAGRLAERWWWRSLRIPVEREPARALAESWVARVEAAPAALALLAGRGAAAGAVEALGSDGAAAVLDALVRVFALPPAGLVDSQATAAAPRLPERRTFGPRAARARVDARWQAVAPEAFATALAAPQRVLLALALALRRAPALARSATAVAALGALAARVEPAPQPVLPEPPAARLPGPFASLLAAPHSAPPDRPWPGPARAAAASFVPPAAGPRALARAGAPAAGPPARAATPATPVPQHAARGAPLSGEQAAVVHTALGGVFFLANVALALGLYGDFTAPRRPGIRLDFWLFLRLLGARLLAPRPQLRDPLWPLLRELASPEPARFRPPALRRAWLAPLDARERALLARPAGRSELDRWIAQVAVCVRAQLRTAGVEPAALLRRPARVEVSAVRVDAAFDLAGHPIAIRRAGLDRDPGWIPAAGRSLVFHFA
jgi:hypothetical protein